MPKSKSKRSNKLSNADQKFSDAGQKLDSIVQIIAQLPPSNPEIIQLQEFARSEDKRLDEIFDNMMRVKGNRGALVKSMEMQEDLTIEMNTLHQTLWQNFKKVTSALSNEIQLTGASNNAAEPPTMNEDAFRKMHQDITGGNSFEKQTIEHEEIIKNAQADSSEDTQKVEEVASKCIEMQQDLQQYMNTSKEKVNSIQNNPVVIEKGATPQQQKQVEQLKAGFNIAEKCFNRVKSVLSSAASFLAKTFSFEKKSTKEQEPDRPNIRH